jgi:peptidoglycan/xylan/chitin deacetylase (PgdA/CDA1 family)
MRRTLPGEARLPWVPVLLYHRVVPQLPQRDPFGNCVTTTTFESHLRWLARRGYRAITVSELTRAALLNRGQRGLRVAITFDDGYEDNLLYAAPLLRRYGFSATVFVVTNTIGSVNSFDAGRGVDPTPMLTAEQVLALAESGIEIGSHGCTHPPSLPDLSDAELLFELQRSKEIVEAIVNRPVRSFSYPHSRVDVRVQAAVEAAGYESACAGVGTAFTPYRLSRVAPPASPGAVLEARMRWRELKNVAARRWPFAARLALAG